VLFDGRGIERCYRCYYCLMRMVFWEVTSFSKKRRRGLLPAVVVAAAVEHQGYVGRVLYVCVLFRLVIPI
jgi:hypothetical protein